MRELIAFPAADTAFLLVVPIIVLVAAGLAARRNRALGIRLGVVGVSISVLWWATNAILDRFGPDSVLGLSGCTVLFLVVGAILGNLGKVGSNARTGV